ncbi:sugar transporter [Sphaerochaeta halotolerans]|uniref:Sugar transporter n=1 Tax=Sphaerochaeta halotolerans TaxID=2293840 RepID=A0A372MHP0_9SPIR|nr:SLBB domain-containing protein [Sphaerochaeta halotolerans]RFU95285.1 sugar transporter [Sphaerochaeta halotolerans]
MNRTRAHVVFVLIILLCSALPLSAEEAGLVIRSPLFGPQVKTSTSVENLEVQSFSAQLGLLAQPPVYNEEQRLLSAVSNGSYPVTPGDAFRLVYLDGMKSVTVDLQVDESSSVAIPGLGSIDGKGKTFAQVRKAIYDMVRTYYSYSNPQLVFIRTGSFMVSVVGEVVGTRVVPAWGLTRLSEVLQNATPYASTRNVRIRHADGSEEAFDLYMALREGVLEQDPLLRSGDVITLDRCEKLVMLSGRVYEQGSYQLLKSDRLEDLLTTYGGGLLSSADVQNIRIQRYNPESGAWYVQYVNLLEQPDYALSHLDQVIVDAQQPTLQTVTVEGAVSSSEVYDSLSTTALVGYPSGRIFYQYYPGESMKQMLTSLASRFLTVSDLEGAYLLRSGKKIPLNIQRILYGEDENQSMQLETGDTLLIPFTQRLVTVSGGVVRPGVFAYVPDKTVNYYLSLAGGLSDDAAYPTDIKIQGPDGKTLALEENIPPETTIAVAKETLARDIAPTVAIIGLVSSILGIIATVVNIILDSKSL